MTRAIKKSGILFFTLFLVFFIHPIPLSAEVIDHNDIDAITSFLENNPEVANTIGQQRWFFSHASVGRNMRDGMNTLHNSNTSFYQLTPSGTSYNSTEQRASDPPFPTAPGTIYECSRGNPGWANKFIIFDNSIRTSGWSYNKVDIVMDKLCYVDPNADPGCDLAGNPNDTDPNFRSSYIGTLSLLEQDYPNTIFVYMTIPLTTGTASSNNSRNQYNIAIRNYCINNNKLLFDIADIEAHDIDGNPVTYDYNGNTYQSLYSGYTSDGGHLNSTGQRQVALGWYAVAAAITQRSASGNFQITASASQTDIQVGDSVDFNVTVQGESASYSYSWDFDDVNSYFMPVQKVWEPGKQLLLGDKIIPRTPNGYIYEVFGTPGYDSVLEQPIPAITGQTEPGWPTTIDETVIDNVDSPNELEFRCIGLNEDPRTANPRHTFNWPGSHYVKVKVTDNSGETKKAVLPVNVRVSKSEPVFNAVTDIGLDNRDIANNLKEDCTEKFNNFISYRDQNGTIHTNLDANGNIKIEFPPGKYLFKDMICNDHTNPDTGVRTIERCGIHLSGSDYYPWRGSGINGISLVGIGDGPARIVYSDTSNIDTNPELLDPLIKHRNAFFVATHFGTVSNHYTKILISNLGLEMENVCDSYPLPPTFIRNVDNYAHKFYITVEDCTIKKFGFLGNYHRAIHKRNSITECGDLNDSIGVGRTNLFRYAMGGLSVRNYIADLDPGHSNIWYFNSPVNTYIIDNYADMTNSVGSPLIQLKHAVHDTKVSGNILRGVLSDSRGFVNMMTFFGHYRTQAYDCEFSNNRVIGAEAGLRVNSCAGNMNISDNFFSNLRDAAFGAGHGGVSDPLNDSNPTNDDASPGLPTLGVFFSNNTLGYGVSENSCALCLSGVAHTSLEHNPCALVGCSHSDGTHNSFEHIMENRRLNNEIARNDPDVDPDTLYPLELEDLSALLEGPDGMTATGTVFSNARYLATDPDGWHDANGYLDPGPYEYTPPTVNSFQIENGLTTTNLREVTLNINVSDSGSGMGPEERFPYQEGALMQFSNDGMAWSQVELYPDSAPYTHSWQLSEGDGQKTVYARFRDRDGNWTTVKEDSITFSTAAPAPPVANDDGPVTATEDTPIIIAVLTNDTDDNNAIDLSSLVVTSAPGNGSVSVNIVTGELTYTPDANYSGADSFGYTVSDADGLVSNEATVTINVNQVNDIPIAIAGSLTTDQNVNGTLILTANDTADPGDQLLYGIETHPTHGTISHINDSTGEVTYSPDTDYSGPDSFRFHVHDGTVYSAPATITITIVRAGPNTAPTATNDEFTIEEDNLLMVGAKTNWYISPNGHYDNTGSIDSPWDINSIFRNADLDALDNKTRPDSQNHVSEVKPGDIIWFRGGRYKHFNRTQTCSGYELRMAGTPERPITLRAYYGERVTIDAPFKILRLSTKHIRVQDIEFIISENETNHERWTQTSGSHPGDRDRPLGGITINTGDDIKIINDIVRSNSGVGIGFWGSLRGESELYGNIIFDNGWTGSDRHHGHGIYTQNPHSDSFDNIYHTDWKYISDNVVFENSCLNMQAYGSSRAWVDRYAIERNLFYSAGRALVGGSRASQFIRVRDNINYASNLQVGYNANGGNDAVVTGNTTINCALSQPTTFSNINMHDNFEWRTLTSAPNNGASIPTSPLVFLNQNRYDTNRANLAIFCLHDHYETPEAIPDYVSIDPAGFLSDGDIFKLMHPYNMYGAPRWVGMYQDAPLDVPVKGTFTPYIMLKHDGSPVAFDDGVIVTEIDTPVDIDVTANDLALTGSIDPGAILIVKQPDHGPAITGTSSPITYTSNSGFTGADTFSYIACDSLGNTTNEATVYISVTSTDTPYVNFNAHEITPYDGPLQDRDNTLQRIEDSGRTIHIRGNTWKAIDFPYYVTPNTVLEFDFSSPAVRELHTIGFDTNLHNGTPDPARRFVLCGSENSGNTDYKDYPESSHFIIPVGKHFTGHMKFMTFSADHDRPERLDPPETPTAESLFSNIKVYESTMADMETTYHSVPDDRSNMNISYVNYYAALSIDSLLDNDNDPDGDHLSFVLESGPSHGKFAQVLEDGSFQDVAGPDITGKFVYVPDSDYNGEDSFTYRVTDGRDTSGAATVTIKINSVNERPVTNSDPNDNKDDYIINNGDYTLQVDPAAGVLRNDSDPHDTDTLTAEVAWDPTLLNSGTTFPDSSGEGHDGKYLYGKPQWTQGLINGAIEFDGNDAAQIPSVDGTSLEELTVSFWFNTQSITRRGGIMRWASHAYAGARFFEVSHYDDILNFYVDGGNRVTTTIQADTWYHVLATLNSSNVWSFYLDGSIVGTYEDEDDTFRYQDSAQAIFLGRAPYYLIGSVDEVRVYDRILTSAEITTLASSTSDQSGLVPGLMGHWKLENWQGDLVLNSNGSFTYTLNPGFSSPATSFTYRVNDGKFLSPIETVTMNVGNVPASIQFDAPRYNMLEDSGETTITVKRFGSAGRVTVDYATIDGTAREGIDYEAAGGTLEWAAGDTTDRTITIRAFEDDESEEDETVKLYLTAPTGGAHLGTQNITTVAILENDGVDISTNLVAYWNFDGDAADSSGFNNHGTLIDDPTFAPGKFGQAIVLDGTNDVLPTPQDRMGDYIDVPHSPSLDIDNSRDSFSISLWYKRDGYARHSRGIFGKDDGNSVYPWHMLLRNDGRVHFRVYDGAIYPTIRSTKAVTDNTWHHIVGVKDRQNNVIKLYIDGLEAATPVTDTTTTNGGRNTHSIWMGRNERSGTYYYDISSLDDVRFYRRALSPAEVQTLSETPNAPVVSTYPEITITSNFTDDMIVSSSSFEISGTIRDASGIASADINGVPLNIPAGAREVSFIDQTVILAQEGDNLVAINATNNDGESIRYARSVILYTLSLSLNPAAPYEADSEIEFTARTDTTNTREIATYEWDFDGNGSIDERSYEDDSAEFTYTAAGTYNVTVTVIDEDGLANSATEIITVSEKPGESPTVSNTLASVTSGPAPLTVSFSSEATDPDGEIVLYEWDFDGNGIYDASSEVSANIIKTYTTPGVYNATLRVTDEDGLAAIDSIIITVSGSATAPSLTLSASTSGDTIPFTVDFTATPQGGGTIVRYEWDFDGDGIFERVATDTESYEYTEGGIFTVSCKVTDDNTLSSIDSIYITAISSALPRTRIIRDDTKEVGEIVDFRPFINTVSGVDRYLFDFNGDRHIDLNTASLNDATHIYRKPGCYRVKIAMIGGLGTPDTWRKVVLIRVRIQRSRTRQVHIRTPRPDKVIGGSHVTLLATVNPAAKYVMSSMEFRYVALADYIADDPSTPWTLIGDPITSRPFITRWDTSSLTDGDYRLSCIVHDPRPNFADIEHTLLVHVDNNPLLAEDARDIEETMDDNGEYMKKQKVRSNEAARVIFLDGTAVSLPSSDNTSTVLSRSDDVLTIKTVPLDNIPTTIKDLVNRTIRMAGGYRDISLSNSNTTFTKDVTITIPYNNEDLGETDEAELKILYFDISDETWKPIYDSVVFPDENKVEAKTHHFTLFGLGTFDTSGDSGGGITSLEGCFIATAAYGTPMAEEVTALSEFRDKYLLKNNLGRQIVKFYYNRSPHIADRIRENSMQRKAIRGILKPVVWIVKKFCN